MPRFVAFLRGVSPTNARMSELTKCFAEAGFTDVRTVLSSGNVVFSAPAGSLAAIERKAEATMRQRLGRAFPAIVRPLEALHRVLASDPYRAFRLAAGSKRVVTFLREPLASKLSLPIEADGASILHAEGGEVYSAYVPSPRGPVFMTLIEKTLGPEVTTRTWDTVRKVSVAAAAPPASVRSKRPLRPK